jgi:16S rRNA (cytosine967-C5)-methyltransferase
MTPGSRLAAAAEILTEIFTAKAAADRTIGGWGKAHRFAGSKDRAAIAERVYAVLRRRNECAYVMDAETPRELVLGSLVVVDAFDAKRIEALCTDGPHALGALSGVEREQLAARRAPPQDQPWVALNYPVWLHNQFRAAFGEDLETEVAALNARAPLDLRVNTLCARRDDMLRELESEGFEPAPCPHAAQGIRLAAGTDAKVFSLAAYLAGRIEIQDEGSQLAVALAEAKPGDTVVDLAAGAGGKSLALAAAMENRGRVLACDIEPVRLRKMEPRVIRAGATIIDIVGDPYGGAIAAAVGEGADIVFVDAPCSGTGTWRRNPESKWTLDEARLANFRAAQVRLLDRAAKLAKPSGRIVYVVCSLLPSEGHEQIEQFITRNPAWRLANSTRLTPARDGTDGFFAAVLHCAAP